MLLTDYKWTQAIPRATTEDSPPGLKLRRLGLQDYGPIFKSMRYLAANADSGRDDEIWLLSHKPVYTQGQAGKAEHILNPLAIPIVQVDRGGQVTYHGPGQLVCYPLLNVKRRRFGVRALVNVLETAVIATLEEFGIEGETRANAPGVYVNNAKIAALGLRIKNGWSYHGLSFNISMDLQPFAGINPCGYAGLQVTQLADLLPPDPALMQTASTVLGNKLLQALGYEPLASTTVKK